MKKTVAVIAGVVGLLGLLFIATERNAPPEMTEAEMAQMGAETRYDIAEQWTGFRDAVLAADYERWASYWTQDTRVLEPGTDLSGDEFFDRVREFFEAGAQWRTFDVESYDLFIHGDAAYQIGQYDESATLGTGEQAESHMYFSVRWVKGSDGRWRISHWMGAPREAPAEG
jgi:ketosteroid isomerase-like protein